MEGLVATGPWPGTVSPADGATDVPRDATLSWTAGRVPRHARCVPRHAPLADVNNATRTNPKGVLASQGQADDHLRSAGVFAYGQTYYWRIDEVNTAADNTIFKGDVWSFTAEPYGYPITAGDRHGLQRAARAWARRRPSTAPASTRATCTAPKGPRCG